MDTAVELQLHKLLAAIVEYKATDLHFTVGNTPSLRIAQRLAPLSNEPLLTPEFIQEVANEVLSEYHQAILAKERSVVCIYSVKAKNRYRVHVYYQRGYLSISFRFIPTAVKPVNTLDVPLQVQQLPTLFQEGSILISGTYGSGKSTVAAGLIEYINQTEGKHIVTFEQPVEFLFNDTKSIVQQREVGIDTPSVADSVSFVDNEDVDVVLLNTPVSEQLVDATIGLAQRGLLVITEVSSASIPSMLSTLFAEVPPDELVATRTAFAQTTRAVVQLQAVPNSAGLLSLAAEVLLMDQSAKAAIIDGAFDKIPAIIQNGTAEGMLSMEQSLALLTQSGAVTTHQL